MSPVKKARKNRPDAVKSVIKKYLGKNAKGRQTIAAFEKDTQNNSDVLVNYLRQQLPKEEYNALVKEIAQVLGGGTSESQINNFIVGGKIDQLINIGRVDKLTIEKKFSPFRDIKQLLVFSVILLLVVGGIYLSYWYSVQPRKMKGKFNIAIAQFGEIKGKDIVPTTLSTEIGNSLRNYLETEFNASNFDLAVDVSNKNMPLVIENADAEDLANQVNATIVIYGTVYVQNGEAKLTPRFYVSPNFDVSELIGETKLAKPIIFNIATLNDQEKVEQDLKTQSSILANFTYSLIYLSDSNFEDAFICAQKAIKTAESLSVPFAGQENLYLIAAHAKSAQKEYDISNQMLDKALNINSNYARAHIARGNIYYLMATNTKPLDSILLDKALKEYQYAYEAQDQPQSANIPIKAHMSIGNIYYLKAQNDNNNPKFYLTAIENYKFVVNEYEKSKNVSIQNLAAWNYFSIGIAYERMGDMQHAIQFYENALKTSSNLKDKATFANQIQVSKNRLVH